MSKYRDVLVIPIGVVLAAAMTVAGCGQPTAEAPAPPPAAPVVDPCALPTTPASTLEETAWRLFVAATCPTSGVHPLTFETWTEQSCLQDPASCTGEAGTIRHLHASHLALGLAATAGLPASECSSMTSSANAPPSLVPFVPQNLAADPKFCEEVFASAAEVAYIEEPAAGHSLLTLTQQAAYVAAVQKIDFPTEAVEIKADWLPANALSSPAFDCGNPTPDLYTEVIDGNCYALVGMHISSKLYPNWLWATFEPQFTATNPNRCKPDLYSSCSDSWGSSPPTSTGEPTQLTPALAALMGEANLAAAFRNYRLVGVQTNFVDTNTTPLGNSFVEFNAQVPAQQASCITCHSYAQFDSSQTPPVENPNFGAFLGTPAVGDPVNTQPPVPPGSWQSQDFSWLLGIMPQE